MILQKSEFVSDTNICYITGDKDILRDEGLAFVKKLETLGLPAKSLNYDQDHGFMCTFGSNPEMEECLDELKVWLEGL